VEILRSFNIFATASTIGGNIIMFVLDGVSEHL